MSVDYVESITASAKRYIEDKLITIVEPLIKALIKEKPTEPVILTFLKYGSINS